MKHRREPALLAAAWGLCFGRISARTDPILTLSGWPHVGKFTSLADD